MMVDPHGCCPRKRCWKWWHSFWGKSRFGVTSAALKFSVLVWVYSLVGKNRFLPTGSYRLISVWELLKESHIMLWEMLQQPEKTFGRKLNKRNICHSFANFFWLFLVLHQQRFFLFGDTYCSRKDCSELSVPIRANANSNGLWWRHRRSATTNNQCGAQKPAINVCWSRGYDQWWE